MGAKSSSFLIETPDIRILVDPGTAEMQGSYPLPEPDKKRLCQKALGVIVDMARTADVIFISHYHNNHHISIYNQSVQSQLVVEELETLS